MPRVTPTAKFEAIHDEIHEIPAEYHSMILQAVVRQTHSPCRRVKITDTDIMFITPLRFDSLDGRVPETPAVHAKRMQQRPDAHLVYAAVWNTKETGVEIHFLAVGRTSRRRLADRGHAEVRKLMRAGRKVIPPHRLDDILGSL